MTKHDPYAAFRIPAFRFYAIGFFASLIGAQIQGTAIGWEMYQRTGEPFALGLVGLSIALPTMVLSLPAGYLADTFNRRNVVLFSMLGTTLTSLGLAFLSWTQSDVTPMYALLILDAGITVLGSPAKRTLLPQIVPRDIFPNAVTWSLSLMKTGWMVPLAASSSSSISRLPMSPAPPAPAFSFSFYSGSKFGMPKNTQKTNNPPSRPSWKVFASSTRIASCSG